MGPQSKTLTERIMIPAIIAVSVFVPFAVFYLMYVSEDYQVEVLQEFDFPMFHAAINFTTSLLLVLGYFSIKVRKRTWHRNLMIAAFFLSCVFLVSYLTSKTINDPVPFGGEGALRYVYYFILISHVMLSAIIIPLVLFTIYRGLSGQLEKHKKIAKYTYPIWLYVTLTGVLVYIFMSPYY